MSMLLSLVFMIGYLIVGAVFAVPYCFLAGWDNVASAWMIALGFPSLLLIWLLLAHQAGMLDVEKTKKGKTVILFHWEVLFGRETLGSVAWAPPVLRIWTIYGLLPIILHWMSMVLRVLGEPRWAEMADIHRYMMLLYIIAVLMALMVLWRVAEILIPFRKIKRWLA